ncbi:hypothetical protein CEXT_72731 [Caerostris extrusa]|uniref:Uncharacterized protein n=1 Tax=Caerostris extrusa TaxID=172846 RepID=A0AAV4TMH3_CAEEX|nr:hypothetical protein CEXT_72731 [Caerostris extrusa]
MRRTVTYENPQYIGRGEVDLMKQNMLRSRDVDAARGSNSGIRNGEPVYIPSAPSRSTGGITYGEIVGR